MHDVDTILSFWFGSLDADGKADPTHAARWWRKDDAFDREIRERFEATWQTTVTGEHESWLATPEGRLAYVIVLDQFPRNMFRGSAQAFASDARALATARQGVELGHDRKLHGEQRAFLYMPFMHSEALADQERCVELFRAFRDESSGSLRDTLDYNLEFAERHRVIVAQWGHFPHRNALLGRASTPEELAFLNTEGSSF